MTQQNHYEILELTGTATQEEIKKQYKKLAVKWHPDKFAQATKEEQEEASEKIKAINSAHETLNDPEKRAIYDEKLRVAKVSLDEEDIVDLTLLRLISHKKPFSDKFKAIRTRLVSEYQKKKLKKEDASTLLKFFYYEVYIEEVNGEVFPNVFMYIKHKKNYPHLPFEFKGKLTPQAAFTLFLEFLKGQHYGKRLHQLIHLFDTAIQSGKNTPEAGLYQGMQAIFLQAVLSVNVDESLIKAIEKITDYARKYASTAGAMSYMAPVLQSKYFRHLFLFALHLYWMTDSDITDDEHLKKLNGEQQARKMFDEYKEKLFDNDNKTELLIRFVRLLHKFEKNVHDLQDDSRQISAAFCREKAYLILDWHPALAGIVGPNIIANTLLQAGIYFQKASRESKKPEQKMADEGMALQCYILAYQFSQHTPPDVTLYVHIHILKNILRFTYAHDGLMHIIQAIQHKTTLIANMFPFFQDLQTNVDFFMQEDQMLVLMRQLLHTLISMGAYNEKTEKKLELDHEYVNILHEAYEACLKNWYDEKYNPAEEKKFRLKLMLELLNLNRWTFENIKANLTRPPSVSSHSALPWITVKRDSQGWMRPDRHLDLPSDPQIKFFRGLRGVEINQNNGEINFIFEPAAASHHSYTEQLISMYDVQEILATKAIVAIFSLDPPDADRPYHPFNKMRFSPAKLYGSQLLHTMFLADYLLKFLTVGWEVQADDPYDFKAVDGLIQKLPPHLKKIILDFRTAEKEHGEDNIHRFWIQAEEMLYEDNDEENKDIEIKKIAFDTVKMIVCKHRMVRDMQGNLIDQEEKGEGFNIYVLKANEHKVKMADLEEPAMIWLDKARVCFYEDGQLSKPHVVKNYGQHLGKLFNLKRDKHHKIIADDPDARATIYRVTKAVAKQAGVEHHFSPEYIFAREFTQHYNEFAIYFPELARLRELSRAVMIVRMMENERRNNQLNIGQLQERIAERDTAFWSKLSPELTQEASKVVNGYFSSIRSKISLEIIQQKRSEQLNDLESQIAGWNVLARQSEIRTEFESNVRKQGIYDFYREDVRSAWEAQYNQIVSVTNQNKRNLLTQLRKVFEDELSNYPYTREDLLNKLLNGDTSTFYSILVEYDTAQVKAQLQQAYSSCSADDLWDALNGSGPALNRIINRLVDEEKEKIKDLLRERVNKLRRVNDAFQRLGLGEASCDILYVFTPPSMEKLHELPIKSKLAYVLSRKALHYVDLAYHQCVEIPLAEEKLLKLHNKFQLSPNKSRMLTEDELETITEITEHKPNDLDLSPVCLWVPASIHHEVEKGYSQRVYGGVQIAGSMNRLNSAEGLLSQQVFSQNNARIPGSTQLEHNRRVGQAFEDHMASQFEAMGFQVRTQVPHQTPFGTRIVDIEVSKNNQVVGNVETKTGNARYSASQQAKDEWIRMTTGVSTTVVRNR